MQDAQQLNQLFASDSSFQMDTYSDVQWVYCTDSATGSQSIQFDTLALMSQPSVFSEGLLTIPINVCSSNVTQSASGSAFCFSGDYRGVGLRSQASQAAGSFSASADAASKVAFKGGNQSMITGVQIQLQSGPTLVNDQAAPWFINQIRPAVECSNDAVQTVGAEGQLFAPKFPHYYRGGSGANVWAYGSQEGDNFLAVQQRTRTSWSQMHENSAPVGGARVNLGAYVVGGTAVGGSTLAGMTVGASVIISTPTVATPTSGSTYFITGNGARPAVLQLTATDAATLSVQVLDPGAGISGPLTSNAPVNPTFEISSGAIASLGNTTSTTLTITLFLSSSVAQGSTATSASGSSGAGISKNPYYNRGYQQSVRAFWQNLVDSGTTLAVTGGNARIFSGYVIIRLKDVHDVFNSLNWPIINTRLTITFNLASPFFAGAPQYCMQLGPETAPPLMWIGAAPSGGSIPSIPSYSGGQCRLYVKQIRFNAADALKMQQRLSSGFQKSITFLEGEAQVPNGLQNHSSGTIGAIVNLATTNAKRIWLFGMPVASLIAPNAYATQAGISNGGQSIGQPWVPVTGTGRLSNATLLVNQKPWRDLNYNIEPEFWIALRNQIRGGGESWSEGSQISYDDWLNGYRLFYCWDLQRVGNRLDKNQPIQLNLTATRVADVPTPGVGIAYSPVDWWIVIEKEANVQIMISAASASIAKTY